MKRDRGTPTRTARHARRNGATRSLRLRGWTARLIGSSVSSMAALGCSLGPDGDEAGLGLVRTELDPPPEYIVWWRELETCSDLKGDMWRVRFLEVVEPVLIDGRQFPCGSGHLCNGMWESPHDISLAPKYVNHERLVKHEMLHELVRSPGHPAVFETCDVTWDYDSGTARDGS